MNVNCNPETVQGRIVQTISVNVTVEVVCGVPVTISTEETGKPVVLAKNAVDLYKQRRALAEAGKINRTIAVG